MNNPRVTAPPCQGWNRRIVTSLSAPSSANGENFLQETYEFDYEGSFMALLGQSLLKKTLNTNWSERYFLLTPTRLMYFADSTMRDLKGCFSLASLIEHRLKVRSVQDILSLDVWIEKGDQNQKTLLQLKIEDRCSFVQWQEELTKVVLNLEKLRIEERSLFPLIRQEQLLACNFKLGNLSCNFWNGLQISPHELTQYASHLDILLLRSKNPLCYLHRFFMRSHYDHVAFLIKDQAERVFLLEAVQPLGVCMTSLENILANLAEEYEEIGYRKLLMKGNGSFQLQKLEEYINKILGSHYELSLTKLFIDNESIPDETASEDGEGGAKGLGKGEGDGSVEDTKKTYFCSQLVAEIYLKFGILAEGKSNHYWPKDFEQDDIIFTQGYSLGPLMKVQLDQLLDLSDQSEL